LRGLGGPGCDFRTGTPGAGACQYLNPFSNGIPGARTAADQSELRVHAGEHRRAGGLDHAHPDGQDGLPGVRAQRRAGRASSAGRCRAATSSGPPVSSGGTTATSTDYSQFGNELISPCSNSAPPVGVNDCIFPTNPNPAVTTGTGPNVFGPVSIPVNIKQNIYAGFGELNLPITDSLVRRVGRPVRGLRQVRRRHVQPAGPHPLAGDRLAGLRSSVGTTFRAPPQGSLIPNPNTNLQNVLGTFIPCPPSATRSCSRRRRTVYSVGAIVQNGGFRGTIDFWNYDFKKVLTSEPLTPVINAVFPNGASGANNCGQRRAGRFSSPRTSASTARAAPAWWR